MFSIGAVLCFLSLQLYLSESEKASSLSGEVINYGNTPVVRGPLEVLRVMESMFCQYFRKYGADYTGIDLSCRQISVCKL